ncbi:MAG: hypothetical protein ACR2PZ_13065 [Pseudomonadales bacterium]
MIVHIHPNASITLDDPDTFSAFAVEAGNLPVTQIVAAFGEDAKAGEDEHIWIAITRLHELGAIHGDADWRAGCDAMIQFASSKGWVDAEGSFVRAHVMRSS